MPEAVIEAVLEPSPAPTPSPPASPVVEANHCAPPKAAEVELVAEVAGTPAMTEEEEEEEDEEEEEEEDGLDDNNATLLTQKDTWGFFASIDLSHPPNGLPPPLSPPAPLPSPVEVVDLHLDPTPAPPVELATKAPEPDSPSNAKWRTRTPSPSPPTKLLGVSGFTPVDGLVLAPRTSWGVSATVKKSLGDGAANLRDETLKSNAVDEKIPTQPSLVAGKRVYTREQLKALESTGLTPPEGLKRCECYSEHHRPRPLPQLQQGGDTRSLFQTQKAFTPGPAVYERLDGKKADTAFSLQNTRKVDTQKKILQKVRGILNRISYKTYDILSEEMWTLLNTHKLMESPEMLERVVDTIYEVALTQSNFGPLSADICVFICSKIRNLRQQSVEGEPAAAPLAEFRRLILNKCQTMFDQSCDHVAAVIPADISETEREAIVKKEEGFRMVSLANITYMAQLFNRNLLSEKIMHMHVIHTLLGKDHTDDANAWLLEFLLKLLELTGKRLDRETAKDAMDGYFRQLDLISRTHPDTRLRHLTFNVIEMRRAGWRTREEVKGSHESLMSSRARAADWEAAQAASKKQEEALLSKKSKGTDKATAAPKDAKKDAKAKGAGKDAPAAKPAAPAAVEPAKALTEEEMEGVQSRARSTLQEWTDKLLSEEELVSQVKEEIPPHGLAHFVCHLTLGCVSSHKLSAQREALPSLAAQLARANVLRRDTLREGFVKLIGTIAEQETWADVPKLWADLGEVLTVCLCSGLVDFDILIFMVAPLLVEEDHASAVFEFLGSVIQSLAAAEFALFDGDKAGRLLLVVQKKKKKKAAKLDSLQELSEALEKLAPLADTA